jgi:hypothetical protein
LEVYLNAKDGGGRAKAKRLAFLFTEGNCVKNPQRATFVSEEITS